MKCRGNADPRVNDDVSARSVRGLLVMLPVAETNACGVAYRPTHVFLLVSLVMLFVWAGALSGLCEQPADMSPYADSGGKIRIAPVTVGNLKIRAVAAHTEKGLRKGFLGWERVSDDEGMLLDFVIESSYSIHMQGMKFPIDAIWADKLGVVNAVYHDIKPNSGVNYPSLSPSRFCLELKAGSAKKSGLRVGDKLEIGIPTVIGK